MTKLMEWIFYSVMFFGVWVALVTKQINHILLDKYSNIVFYFPVTIVILFGVYATGVVLWRVYTFNNCEEAAIELKKQIQEAKEDLRRKGFEFYEGKT